MKLINYAEITIRDNNHNDDLKIEQYIFVAENLAQMVLLRNDEFSVIDKEDCELEYIDTRMTFGGSTITAYMYTECCDKNEIKDKLIQKIKNEIQRCDLEGFDFLFKE